ncbi:UNVERIFIED_CONTAM: hypothetical protein GTU68_058133, partial [Idotea baltica]|nr:hypothetical protein [Idotea baltica]
QGDFDGNAHIRRTCDAGWRLVTGIGCCRFVVLVDCGHVFESRGLQNWMQMTVVDGRTEIGMKKCPRCSVPIYNTKKYQSIIMETYQKVSKVKGVYYASKSSNQSRSIIKVLQGSCRKDFKIFHQI